MKPFLRTLMLWLVLLAVPFQGFASAAMLGCATGHMPAPVSVESGHAHHGMHGMHRMHDAGRHPSQLHTPHQADHHGNAKCGACSACSIGAAIAPAAILALPVHAPPRLAAPFAVGPLPSVDLDLPERPPRFFLA